MTKIDWPGLIRVGLFDLKLTPKVFWSLTPIELRIMLGADQAASSLTRARLDELAKAFPDTKRADSHDGNRGPDGTDRDTRSLAGRGDVGHFGL